MVLFEKNNMDILLFLTLLLCIPLIKTENIDCNGKSFHCVNSTYFMICVDIGGGLSMALSSFVLPCPPKTVCLDTNSFECEFRVSTTQKSIFHKSEVVNELKEINPTTIAYGNTVLETDSLKTENTLVLPLQKYNSIETTNKILEDNTIDTTIINNESVSKNGNDGKDNIKKKLKPETAVGLNSTNQSKLRTLDPKYEFEQVMNNVTADGYTTEGISSKLVDDLSSAIALQHSDDYYNFEDVTQNNTINTTNNSTLKNLINNTDNNIFTDVSKNNKNAIVEDTKATTGIHAEKDMKFNSNMSVGNTSSKEAITLVSLSNISFNDVEFNNNVTNEENNGLLNILSNNNDIFTTINVYETTKQQFTTENIQSLTETSTITENLTQKTFSDTILKTTTNEAFAATNASERFLEKSIKTSTDPIPDICGQIGNNNCLENNDTVNTVNDTKITTIDTLSSLDGGSEVTTPNLLNTDKDYLTLYDETDSTIIMSSTDRSNVLQSFTDSYSENKLHDIISTSLPNYLIKKTTLERFNQESNTVQIDSTTVNIEADIEKKYIDSLTTESSPTEQILSGFQSTTTTIKPLAYLNSVNEKQNISYINITENTTTDYLKLGTPGKVKEDKTINYGLGTEMLDRRIKKSNIGVSDKPLNNEENDFADKTFTSDRYTTLSDSMNEPYMTPVNSNLFSSKVSINNEIVVNNTKAGEENYIQQDRIKENIDNFTTEETHSIEPITNIEELSKNSTPENVMTTLYPDNILATTISGDLTITYPETSFPNSYVTSYLKHEYTTSSSLEPDISALINELVNHKNNNSMSYVHKNIITDKRSPKGIEKNKNITFPNVLKIGKDNFTLNGEIVSTVPVNITNSSNLLDSAVNFKNQDNVILKGNSNSINENQVTLETTTDNEHFKANNSFNLIIFGSTSETYDTTTVNHAKENFGINLEKIKKPLINTMNYDKKFRDLESTTIVPIIKNNNYANKNNFSDAKNDNQSKFNITTVIDQHELGDNVISNNSVSSKSNDKLTIIQLINNNMPLNDVSRVNLSNEKINHDLQEYNPQINSETVTEATSNGMKQYTHSILDIIMNQNFNINHDKGNKVTVNEKGDTTRLMFETSTLSNENTQEYIFAKVEGESNKEISQSNALNVTQDTADNTIGSSHTIISLNGQNMIVIDKNNSINKSSSSYSNNQKIEASQTKQYINIHDLGKNITSDQSINEIVNDTYKIMETTMKIPSSEKSDNLIMSERNPNKNFNTLDKSSINSKVELIKNETAIKSKSTEILLNVTDDMLTINLTNENKSHINSKNVSEITEVLPDHAMVIDKQQRHIFLGITTTDKINFSADVTNAKNITETATVLVNIVPDENITKYEIDKSNVSVLNSTLTNYTQVSSNTGTDIKYDERYISVEKHKDVSLKTKDSVQEVSILIPDALHEISNKNTEMIRDIRKSFKDIVSINNTRTRDLQESKTPVNNITDIKTTIIKEHQSLQPTTHFDDFLLITSESTQGLATTTISDLKIMQKRNKVLNVTTYYPQFGDSGNLQSIKSSNFGTTLPFIPLNTMEDLVSTMKVNKPTTESGLNTGTLPIEIDTRTDSNKSKESRLMTDEIKKAVKMNQNNSRSQFRNENNNNPSNILEIDTSNNVSSKPTGNQTGIRNNDKKNITTNNLIEDIYQLQPPLLNNSTEMPNSLKFTSTLVNNEIHERANFSHEVKLHGSHKINATTYSSIHKIESMINESTTKHSTTTLNCSNTNNYQKTSYTNTLSASNADTSTSRIHSSVFYCKNNVRSKFAHKNNCRKFYICMGSSIAAIGLCPINTVFSDYRKQCTNNLSHCVRNYQFQCVKEGRFSDVTKENVYYVCIKGIHHSFIRFKFQCQSGYILDKKDMICKIADKMLKSSSSSLSLNDTSTNKKLQNHNRKKQNFKCEKEGRFVDPFNSRRYYICFKTPKSILRRRRKKCDSDEVFDDYRNECVDRDSHEYS